MICADAPPATEVVAHNVRRLLARLGWRYDDLVEASGLDERTIRRLVRGETEPRSGTLQRLADAFGVSTDELFLETSALFAAQFDRATNPQVQQAIEGRPDLFAGWGQLDFDELNSRFGVGGELTVDGAVQMATDMNRRRETLRKAQLVLETSQGELLEEFVEMLLKRCNAGGDHASTTSATGSASIRAASVNSRTR